MEEKEDIQPETAEEYLKDLYYTPANPSSFSGIEKLWHEVRTAGKPFALTKKKVKEWLGQQDTHVIFKHPKDNFPRERIIVGSLNEEWDSDVMSMIPLKKLNKGYAYVTVFIDLFSHQARARPMKTKTGVEMSRVMAQVFGEGSKPHVLRTDGDYLFHQNIFMYNSYIHWV